MYQYISIYAYTYILLSHVSEPASVIKSVFYETGSCVSLGVLGLVMKTHFVNSTLKIQNLKLFPRLRRFPHPKIINNQLSIIN